MRVLPLVLLAAVSALAQDRAAAPENLPDSPVIKVQVNLVNVLCTVHDKHGGLVGNLEKTDFTVFEDGKKQDLKYFTRETNLPLTLGLLVDVSASQERLMDIEKRAAYEFFKQVLKPKDEAFLISFGAEAELLQDRTNSPNLLEDGLNQLHLSVPLGGLHPGPVPTANSQAGTILYDAVYLASHDVLKGEVGRKAVILITDGVDTGSKMSRDQAIRAAQLADTMIYSIYYVDPAAYGYGYFGGGGGEGELRRMSDETGGRVFKVDRRHTLSDAFQEIQAEMRSQYALGYSPTNTAKDGSYRKLDIRVSNKDYKVQARKGYYAVAATGDN
jgi:VWFA-related protein